MLQMSRSTHDMLHQGDICMLRRDADIQLVGTDTQNHAGKEGNQCKLANRRKVTLCCWLWEVICNMLQRRTAQVKKKHKKELYTFLRVRVCVQRAYVCTHPVCVCVRMGVCLCLFQPRELKSRTNQKLPDSTRPYPM